MNPLTAVRQAARTRAESETRYRQAMVAARQAGHTYAAIGAAAGITAEGAMYIVKGDPRKNGERT